MLLTLVLLLASHCAAQDEAQTRAEALAKKEWGANLRKVEALDSPHLQAALKDAKAFRAVVFNPVSQKAGRPTYDHALLLQGEKATIITEDAQAEQALTDAGLPVPDIAAAVSRLLAFSELRGYALRLHDRGGLMTPFPLAVTADNNGWAISCVFETDPYIHLRIRYGITVTAKGAFATKPCEVVGGHGGYR